MFLEYALFLVIVNFCFAEMHGQICEKCGWILHVCSVFLWEYQQERERAVVAYFMIPWLVFFRYCLHEEIVRYIWLGKYIP